MLFSDFLTELIDSALHIFHRSARQSEEFRKSHYEKDDEGNMNHRTTKRQVGTGMIEVPDKSQHDVSDYLVDKVKFETETDISVVKGNLETQVRHGLFKKAVKVKIEIEVSKSPAPEGVHAHVDALNDDLKRRI